MKRLRMLVVPAVLFAVGLVVALPAQARAGSFSGVVVAKQKARGTMLVAGAHGAGVTVRGRLARAHVGDRIAVTGCGCTTALSTRRVACAVARAACDPAWDGRPQDGPRHAAGERAQRRPDPSPRAGTSRRRRITAAQSGDVARFRIRFDDDEAFEDGPRPGRTGEQRPDRGTIALALRRIARSLPLTITVPAGTNLPSGLAPGQRIGSRSGRQRQHVHARRHRRGRATAATTAEARWTRRRWRWWRRRRRWPPLTRDSPSVSKRGRRPAGPARIVSRPKLPRPPRTAQGRAGGSSGSR